MTIRRITISVPEPVAERIKKAAGKRAVSRWVTELIEEHLDDAERERQWREFCRAVRPSPADERRADAMFKRLVGTKRKRSTGSG